MCSVDLWGQEGRGGECVKLGRRKREDTEFLMCGEKLGKERDFLCLGLGGGEIRGRGMLNWEEKYRVLTF